LRKGPSPGSVAGICAHTANKKYISKIKKQFKKTNANLWVPYNKDPEMFLTKA
jgi:hypothetical protein